MRNKLNNKRKLNYLQGK